MTSLVNKSADWTPNYNKILIFSPTKSLKSLRAARIDELADSNEPANMLLVELMMGGKGGLNKKFVAIIVTNNFHE